MATASTGLNGSLSLLLVDPLDLHVLWKKTKLDPQSQIPADAGHRFYSMVLADINKDGKQEILLSTAACQHGRIVAFDPAGKMLFSKADARIPDVPYRMNLLEHVKLPGDEFLAGQFANILIIYNLDGSCREVVTMPDAYANRAFDPVTRTLYLGSSVSGGDEIVSVRLDRPGWQQRWPR